MSTARPSGGWTTGQCLNAQRRGRHRHARPPRRRRLAPLHLLQRDEVRFDGADDAGDRIDIDAMGALDVPGQHRRLEHARSGLQMGAPPSRTVGQMADLPRFLHPFARPARTDFTVIARGEGALVWDEDGREYVDAMASLWYCAAGHGRAEIADAVAAQLSTLAAYSCFEPFSNRPADDLAERVADALTDPRRQGVPLRLGLRGRGHGDQAGPPHPLTAGRRRAHGGDQPPARLPRHEPRRHERPGHRPEQAGVGSARPGDRAGAERRPRARRRADGRAGGGGGDHRAGPGRRRRVPATPMATSPSCAASATITAPCSCSTR